MSLLIYFPARSEALGTWLSPKLIDADRQLHSIRIVAAPHIPKEFLVVCPRLKLRNLTWMGDMLFAHRIPFKVVLSASLCICSCHIRHQAFRILP